MFIVLVNPYTIFFPCNIMGNICFILHSTGQHAKDIKIDMSSVFNPKWDFSTNVQVSQDPISTGKCL